ncbi:MAG: transcriptional regulator [Bdellovibrionales bacterium RIFOXYD1_FULL_53_11]|nr:MAG: transcriptional regulator [Bdellovibrionales bacterium RIFOXYD1_FULL_53_11]
MLEKDVILSKISIVQNCLKTIRKITNGDGSRLEDPINQDVFVLNLQRAAQACIDIAHTIIAEKNLKLPASYKESFEILARENIIPRESAAQMKKMAGFRNIAVHDYEQLDVNILKSILANNLTDLEVFCSHIFSALN